MHHLVYFFCFRHHHTYTIFSLRYYVVVILALRVPSNSVSLLHGFAPCLHTSFPICLLKSSCNSYPTSTCLMTNTLRVLESRVFLHYLIKSIAQFYKLSIKSMYYIASLYKNSYFIFASLVSIIIVTGPSFRSSTFISAPNSPS